MQARTHTHICLILHMAVHCDGEVSQVQSDRPEKPRLSSSDRDWSYKSRFNPEALKQPDGLPGETAAMGLKDNSGHGFCMQRSSSSVLV